MNSSELEKTVAKIAGLRLEEVWCACEMLMFRFAQYSLHAQCPTRIVGKGGYSSDDARLSVVGRKDGQQQRTNGTIWKDISRTSWAARFYPSK